MKKTNFFRIINDCNLITCIQSFYFGMISVELKGFLLTKRISGVVSLIILIFLCNYHFAPPFVLIYQMQGFSLFILLVNRGNFIMKMKFKYIFLKISKLSYYMYLIHHCIIKDVLGVNNPNEWYNSIIILLVSILIIIIYSKIISII